MKYDSRKVSLNLYVWLNVILIVVSLLLFIVFIGLSFGADKVNKSAVCVQGTTACVMALLGLVMNVAGIAFLIASAMGKKSFFSKIS